ncbi:hypothetical protein BDQ17DRAFT_1539017 [Cyathus striatus]|nr:hypothetical protein BDQ17DRAFT_1539017 [Cyathus striatus]
MNDMASPFAHLFSTNCYPTTEEAAGIKLYCDNTKNKIEYVDTEIEKTLSVLNGLIERRDNLQQDLKSHQALLPPFRQLPPEIIGRIFYCCLPTIAERLSDSWISSLSTEVAPLQLTQVCSSWREIALNTPRLWTFISLSPSRSSIMDMEFQARNNIANAINLWASRAANLPLSFRIFLEECWDLSLGRNVLKSLVPFHERWGELYITVPAKSFDVWKNENLNLCALKEFHVGSCRARRGNLEGAMPKKLFFLQHASNLSSLTVRGFAPFSVVPKKNLKEFTYAGAKQITSMSEADILYFARECPFLETLNISGDIRHGPVDGSVRLSSLRKLSITVVLRDTFYDNMNAPNLQDLEVTFKTQSDSLEGFIFSHSKSLTTLTIGHVSKLAALNAILRLAPNLTCLRLVNRNGLDISMSYINSLLPSPSDDPLVPNLQKLVVMPCQYSSWGYPESVLNLLEMRHPEAEPVGFAKMCSIHLGISGLNTIQEDLDVEPLIVEGVDIKIIPMSFDRAYRCKEVEDALEAL